MDYGTLVVKHELKSPLTPLLQRGMTMGISHCLPTFFKGGIKGGFKKGQVIIEATLFFIALLSLLLITVRIWVWSNNQIALRQQAYNNSRVEAGTVALPNMAAALVWVIEDAARGDRQVSNPQELSSGWVFRGQ